MAAPDFQTKYTQEDVPSGVPVFMPSVSIAAGSNKGIAFTHKPLHIKVINLSAAADEIVVVANTAGALTTAFFPIVGAGGTLELEDCQAIKELHFKNIHGSSTATIYVMAILSRERVDTGHPALTTANHFPAVSTADADALVPGVA
jgi:hypothetical protein